jgi:hypothetical protein
LIGVLCMGLLPLASLQHRRLSASG